MCIAPITLRRSGKIDTVPCGRCLFCLQKKRADWSFRLYHEMRDCDSAYFLTLTYNDENLIYSGNDENAVLSKEHLQLFKKRLRKANSKFVKSRGISGKSIRYYSVGEYGTVTNRPHYHSIIFNVHPQVIARLQDIWQLGNVMVGSVTPASIHYVTKYVINRYSDVKGREPPFAVMSRRPGLGSNYLIKMKAWHRDDMRNYAINAGVKQRLPRYYKDKIFTQFERQLMAIESIAASDKLYYDAVQTLLLGGSHDPCGELEGAFKYKNENYLRVINRNDKF